MKRNNTLKKLIIFFIILGIFSYCFLVKTFGKSTLFENMYSIVVNKTRDRKKYLNYLENNILENIKNGNYDTNKENEAAKANFKYYIGKYIINNDLSEFYFGEKDLSLKNIEILNYERIASLFDEYSILCYDFYYRVSINGIEHFVYIANSIEDNINEEDLKNIELKTENKAKIYTDVVSKKYIEKYIQDELGIDKSEIVSINQKSINIDCKHGTLKETYEVKIEKECCEVDFYHGIFFEDILQLRNSNRILIEVIE